LDTKVEPQEAAGEQAPTYGDAVDRVIDLADQWRETARHTGGELADAILNCACALEREFGVLKRVVGIYMVDRAFGGHEEGGWYYDTGVLFKDFEPIICRGNEEARAAHAKCEAYIAEHKMNDGRHDPNSVLCEGWYASWAFSGDAAPDHFPAVKPRYE